jgi:hypothetical protein
MGITIDKQNYIVLKTSYGHYVDNEGINYPFSVEVNETAGEKKWIEIYWDDDSPKNISNVMVDILDMFS